MYGSLTQQQQQAEARALSGEALSAWDVDVKLHAVVRLPARGAWGLLDRPKVAFQKPRICSMSTHVTKSSFA